MAEQFILPKATSRLLRDFMKTVPCTVTALAHDHVGWNQGSRAAYDGMMGLNQAARPVGRGSLPPHFYIEIPVKTFVPNTGDTDLVRSLSRGIVPEVLKALDAKSAASWATGRVFEALNDELQKGNVSISIYHLDGTEVGATERDTVNGFPKKTAA
jgi:hypothetical protein